VRDRGLWFLDAGTDETLLHSSSDAFFLALLFLVGPKKSEMDRVPGGGTNAFRFLVRLLDSGIAMHACMHVYGSGGTTL